MKINEFAHFCSLHRNRVVKTASSFWLEIYPFIYQNIPFFNQINPSKEEIYYLFFRRCALLVRHMTNQEVNSIPQYLWVFDDKRYGLQYLDGKTRNLTRRGLEKVQVRQVDFNYLAEKGYELFKDTALRQGRYPDFSSNKKWGEFCINAQKFPDFEAWGGIVEEELASFLVAIKIDDWYYMLYQASKSDLLNYRPNNALIYTVIMNKIDDQSIKNISYGLDSVEFTYGLNKFKTSMGFKRRKIFQKIYLNPMINCLANEKFILLINKILKRRLHNNYIRKSLSVLNLLLESKS